MIQGCLAWCQSVLGQKQFVMPLDFSPLMERWSQLIVTQAEQGGGHLKWWWLALPLLSRPKAPHSSLVFRCLPVSIPEGIPHYKLCLQTFACLSVCPLKLLTLTLQVFVGKGSGASFVRCRHVPYLGTNLISGVVLWVPSLHNWFKNRHFKTYCSSVTGNKLGTWTGIVGRYCMSKKASHKKELTEDWGTRRK